MPCFWYPLFDSEEQTMFILNIRKFQTGADLDKLLSRFFEFKEHFEEAMPGKTMEIVDIKFGLCDAIYYRVKEKK